MTYTDYSVDGIVAPQDGGWSGINDDPDADWINAAISGALAKAQGSNYAPDGLSLTADHTNEEVSIGKGTAFIELEQNVDYRNFDDSEINRSRTWEDGLLTLYRLASAQTLGFETTTGINYIWVFYNYPGTSATGQNETYIRIGTDKSTEDPATTDGYPGILIGQVDAGADAVAVEKNRTAGYSWNFLGKQDTGGAYVSEASISIPDNSYDEYKIKFIGVLGDATSTGIELQARANNHNANYWYRTTQNNTQGGSLFKLFQGRPDHMTINGHLYCGMQDYFTFDNRLTSNQEKQYAFSGGNTSAADTTPLNSLQFFYNSGNIKGEWNIWARNTL